MSLLLRRRALAVVVPPVSAPNYLSPGFRYSAQIGKDLVFFDSLETLNQILYKHTGKEKKKAVKRAAAKFNKGAAVQIPYVPVEPQMPRWAVERIQAVNASLEAYFWAQYRRLIDQDDEDAITALYG